MNMILFKWLRNGNIFTWHIRLDLILVRIHRGWPLLVEKTNLSWKWQHSSYTFCLETQQNGCTVNTKHITLWVYLNPSKDHNFFLLRFALAHQNFSSASLGEKRVLFGIITFGEINVFPPHHPHSLGLPVGSRLLLSHAGPL